MGLKIKELISDTVKENAFLFVNVIYLSSSAYNIYFHGDPRKLDGLNTISLTTARILNINKIKA